jgi:hypothetical protein
MVHLDPYAVVVLPFLPPLPLAVLSLHASSAPRLPATPPVPLQALGLHRS